MSSPSTTPRKAPHAIIRKTPATKTYVGIAKSVPDSRTPRRFITVSSRITPIAQGTLFSTTKGTAEPRFSMPEEIDTATVST